MAHLPLTSPCASSFPPAGVYGFLHLDFFKLFHRSGAVDAEESHGFLVWVEKARGTRGGVIKSRFINFASGNFVNTCNTKWYVAYFGTD